MKNRMLSFMHAMNGIKLLFKKEMNFKLHVLFASMAIILGNVVYLSRIEWILLLLTIGLVLFSEIINTVIERFSDMIQPEKDPRIKEIKDLSAGAVLISSACALTVGFFLFSNKILFLCSTFFN